MKLRNTLVVLVFTLAGLTTLEAQNWWKRAIRGEGSVVTRTVDLPAFDGVKSGYSCDIILTQGPIQKVEMEGQENILDNLRLDVDAGVLRIKYDRMVRRAENVKIYITIPKLTVATVSGSGDMETTNTFTGLDDLEVGVSGSGDLELDIEARHVYGKVSGSGDIELDGQADFLEVSISGSGGMDASDLTSNTCEVNVSGSGGATVYAREAINARVSGSGSVRYKGNPPQVSSKVSGSGGIRAM